MKINMVRVEVVGDVRRLAGPRLERLELVLRLRHVGLEEAERAELLDAIARISVYRIVSFMDLDAAEHALLFRQCCQFIMLFERFYWRFSYHHMNPVLDAMLGNGKVRVVGREDDGAVAFF